MTLHESLPIPLPESLLEIDAITCLTLAPVSFDLAAGECATVSGASGSGKSLFLRAVADLDPNDGDVRLVGQSRNAMAAPTWRRQVVYVPAESGWWADDVGSHFPDRDAAAGFLKRLELSTDCFNWPVARLSTGERQRLALIRAMVLAPRVMLLDEPTSGLDPDTTLRVEGLLHEILANGAAMIVVSHDRAQARRLGHRRFQIADGKLAELTDPVMGDAT